MISFWFFVHFGCQALDNSLSESVSVACFTVSKSNTNLPSICKSQWANSIAEFLVNWPLVARWPEHEEERAGIITLTTPVLPHQHRPQLKVPGVDWDLGRVAWVDLVAACGVCLITPTVATVPPPAVVLLGTVTTLARGVKKLVS